MSKIPSRSELLSQVFLKDRDLVASLVEIFHQFRRDDFSPKPKVQSSMIRFRKRGALLLDSNDKRLYELFIQRGFGGGKRLKQNLENAKY